MKMTKLLPFILCLLLVHFMKAQQYKMHDLIEVSITLQNKKSLHHVYDASIVLCEVLPIKEICYQDTLISAISVQKILKNDRKYRIVAKREGFHTLDTIFKLDVRSLSDKKRLFFFMKPLECFKVKAVVKDELSKLVVFNGDVQIFDKKAQLAFAPKRLKNGCFEFCGACFHDYEIRIQADGYMDATHQLYLKDPYCNFKSLLEKSYTFVLEPSYPKSFFDAESKIIIQDFFEPGTTELSIHGKHELERLLFVLKEHPAIRIDILIEVAEQELNTLNRKLAEQRARRLDRMMEKAGITLYRYYLKCDGKTRRNSLPGRSGQQLTVQIKK